MSAAIVMEKRQRHPFVSGVVMALPIFVGYTALGIPFGILGVNIGMPAWSLVLMSVFVLAGSAQFVAIQLIGAGAGPTSIIAAAFILNLRHLFMGMSLGSVLARTRLPFMVYLAHSITDESFGVNIVKVKGDEKLYPMSMFGTNLVAHVSWVAATLLGAWIGNRIPVRTEIAAAALPIMFVVLLALQFRAMKYAALAILAAIATAILMWHVPGNWPFIIAAVVVPTLATFYDMVREHEHS